MAFMPTTRELIEEIEGGERLRDEHLKGVNQIIREYTGRWYRGMRAPGPTTTDLEEDWNPEPFSYSFVSNILPSLIYENPAANVKARRVIGHKEIAEAMETGIKSWQNDVPFKREFEQGVLDYLFFQGVFLHYIEDDERWSDGAVRPNFKRIDYNHFGIDALADSVETAEFLFHDYLVEMDELMADPDLDPEALNKLKPTAETGKEKDAFNTQRDGASQRKRVRVYSVWMRRANTIRIVCKDPGIELYPERPYYGPECGPYTVLQAYPVPGQAYPLSPLVAVQDLVRDINTHGRAAARAAASRKTNVIVDGAVSGLDEGLKNSEDQEVLSVPGFNASQAMQMEFGGVSDSQYEHLAALRVTLREHSGLTETVRGSVSGGTATEQQIASESLNNRLEYLKSKVRDGCSKLLYAVGWFLFHTPGIIIPVSQRDPLTGMETEGLFFGGTFPGENAGSWKDYSIHIQPYSMQRVSEELIQRRALEYANFLVSMGQAIPVMPWIRWNELFNMVGEAMNQDNAQDLIIPEVLGGITQMGMVPPSSALGQEDTPGRYSVPGQGFKPRMGLGNENSNASPAVDERRASMSKPFGDMYGGTQGPPGSKSR